MRLRKNKNRMRTKKVKYRDRELELVVDLGDEEIVRQLLASLHDSHNGSIDLREREREKKEVRGKERMLQKTIGSDLVLPVQEDPFLGILLLLGGLLELDGIHLDPGQRVLQAIVEGEEVISVNVLALGSLGQDPDLATRQRLEGPLQFLLLCNRRKQNT